jgi:hypothetical protein
MAIPSEPPTDQRERAIWTIRRLTKAVTGKEMSQAEAEQLYAKAEAQMTAAMASVTPKPPGSQE